MEGLAVVVLLCAFLPFLVSLGGSGGVWKFLSFLFCCFSVVGSTSAIGHGGGILAWVIAWSFTALAFQARRGLVVALVLALGSAAVLIAEGVNDTKKSGDTATSSRQKTVAR